MLTDKGGLGRVLVRLGWCLVSISVLVREFHGSRFRAVAQPQPQRWPIYLFFCYRLGIYEGNPARPEVFIVDSGGWVPRLPKCENKSSGSMGFPSRCAFSCIFLTVFALLGQNPAGRKIFLHILGESGSLYQDLKKNLPAWWVLAYNQSIDLSDLYHLWKREVVSVDPVNFR